MKTVIAVQLDVDGHAHSSMMKFDIRPDYPVVTLPVGGSLLSPATYFRVTFSRGWLSAIVDVDNDRAHWFTYEPDEAIRTAEFAREGRLWRLHYATKTYE